MSPIVKRPIKDRQRGSRCQGRVALQAYFSKTITVFMIIVSSNLPRQRALSLQRRRFTCFVVSLFLGSLFFECPPAAASSGYRALDEAAIPVKFPDKAILLGVALAGHRLVAVGEHGIIIYSDDNGRSWHQSQVPVSVDLTDVAFADAQHGWAVGHYGVILKTDDGGVNWVQELNGIQVNNLALAAAKLAMADNDPAPGTPLAMRRAAAFAAGGPDKPFLSLLVQNAEDVTVFGAYRIAVRTTDGGKTWVDWSLHVGDALSHNLYDVAAAGNAIYLAAETGLVFRSADGGNTYSGVTAPTNSTLFGTLVLGPNDVFVYGVAGAAFRSSDAGKTWHAVNLGTGSNLVAALKLSSGQILVATEDGRLMESNDGVSTFTYATAVPMAIFDLAQAASGDVIAVGDGGVKDLPLADFVQR